MRLEPRTIGPAVEQPGVVRSTRRVAAPGSEFAGFRFQPEVITLAVRTDRAAAYPRVLDALLPAAQHVTGPYENNRIETDHRACVRTEPCGAVTTNSRPRPRPWCVLAAFAELALAV